MILNGTRIVSKKVISSIGCLFINTHCGITPKYRGVHGGYWAIYNNDLNNYDEISSINNDFDCIFHFAAKLGVADVNKEPYEVLKTNISTTETSKRTGMNEIKTKLV